MKGAMTIFAKDLKGYFTGPAFYIISFLFTGYLSYTYYVILRHFAQRSMFFMMQNHGQGEGLNLHQEVVVHHISNVNLVLLFLMPFLAVRLFTEEKKMHTMDLLLTSPVTATQIVVGKFLAAIGVAWTLVAVSALYPLSTSLFAQMEWGTFLSSYGGLLLLAACYAAVAVLCSSLTDSVLLAGILAIITTLMLWFVGWMNAISEDTTMQAIINQMSVSTHFGNMVKGSLQLSSFIYFGSVLFLFGFLTQRVVESARWR